MSHVLVTGASGFIGHHLVKALSERGDQVTCLVRRTSSREGVDPYDPNFCIGDVEDLRSMRRAVVGADVVYHLAGMTKCLRRADLMRVNKNGSENLAIACAESAQPPVLVLASSLAAAGPSPEERPRVETDPPTPVSIYGESKLAGENAARAYADRVPMTIVRPPIVFGEGDKDGLNLFQGIARLGIHLVPGFRDHQFSAIHAEDLATALVLAAAKGRRIEPTPTTRHARDLDGGGGDVPAAGVYYAADPQIVSYAEFGKMIGRCLGRPDAWVVRSPGALVWAVSAFNELFSQIRRRPHILNLDKAREATAGSWACSPERLMRDTGFTPAMNLEQRIDETAEWYERQGCLHRKPSHDMSY